MSLAPQKGSASEAVWRRLDVEHAGIESAKADLAKRYERRRQLMRQLVAEGASVRYVATRLGVTNGTVTQAIAEETDGA